MSFSLSLAAIALISNITSARFTFVFTATLVTERSCTQLCHSDVFSYISVTRWIMSGISDIIGSDFRKYSIRSTTDRETRSIWSLLGMTHYNTIPFMLILDKSEGLGERFLRSYRIRRVEQKDLKNMAKNQDLYILFYKKFGGNWYLFVRPLIPLFSTSGDVYPASPWVSKSGWTALAPVYNRFLRF